MATGIGILATWPIQENAKGYIVRLIDSQGQLLVEQDVVTTRAFFDSVQELTTYQLELTAYNNKHVSVPQLITVTTPAGSVDASSLAITWEDDELVDTARLLDGDGNLVQDLGEVSSPTHLTDLPPGTAYQLEVTRSDGWVRLIPFYSAVELPDGIANLQWDYTRTSLSFTWDASLNASQYGLHLTRQDTGEEVEQKLVSDLTATFEGLQGGTFYELRIYAINVNGGESPETFLTGKTSPVPLDIVGDQYAETVYLMKPVAYWRMSDEAGSLVVRDMMERFEGVVNGASPFGNHASIMPSGGGRAAYFDGTTWMDFGNHADLGPRNSMAVAFWFKPTDDSVRRGLVHKAYGGTLGSTYEPANTISFYHGTSGTDGGTYQGVNAEAPVNEVRHVVLERDNDLGYLTMYMNGYPVLRTKDSYLTANRGSYPFKIGKGHVTDLFKGYIQDVALFDYAPGDKGVADMVTAAGGEPPLVPDFGYFSVGGLALGNKIGWNPLTPERYRLPNPTARPRHGRTEVMGKVVTSQNIGFFDQIDGSGGHPLDRNGRPSDFRRQGVIQGTVTDDQGKPASRRIQVLERRTGRLVRQGWSDPERGQYRFDDLDTLKEWTVIGYDLSGTYNALISDRVRSVALRYDKHGSTTVPVVVWFTVSEYVLKMQWAPVRGEPDEIRLYMSKTSFDESNLPEPEILTGDTREFVNVGEMVFDDWYVAVGFVAGSVETISEVYKYTSTTDKPADWDSPVNQVIRGSFSQGEYGALYVVEPVVNGSPALFQDSSATVPVSTDGDPVGFITDISGNNNHAIQPDEALKPIYRTDGVLHWLDMSGGKWIDLGTHTFNDHAMALAYDTAGKNSGLLWSEYMGSSNWRYVYQAGGTTALANAGHSILSVHIDEVDRLPGASRNTLSTYMAGKHVSVWQGRTNSTITQRAMFGKYGTASTSDTYNLVGRVYMLTWRKTLYSESERMMVEGALRKQAGLDQT